MKRFFAFVIMAILFASCAKQIDAPADSISLQVSSNVSGLPYANCKLRSIAQEDLIFRPKIAYGQFTYYHHGNPFSLVYNAGSGNSDYYFYYDKKTRLSELYVDGYLLPVKHRYTYNNKDQIVIDTLFNATTWTEEQGYVFAPRLINVLTYDNKGRIIKEVSTEASDGRPFATYTYTYDNRGNLVVPGYNYPYDNKVSIFRAHPVFQFVNRNYSMNNPVQSAYNSKGLPLTFRPSNDAFFEAPASNVGGFIGGLSKVIYDCQ